MVVSDLQSDTFEYQHLKCDTDIIRIKNPYIRIFRITNPKGQRTENYDLPLGEEYARLIEGFMRM